MDGTSTPGLSNSTAPSGYGAVAARTSTYNPCARSFGKPYTKMRNSVASKPNTLSIPFLKTVGRSPYAQSITDPLTVR